MSKLRYSVKSECVVCFLTKSISLTTPKLRDNLSQAFFMASSDSTAPKSANLAWKSVFWPAMRRSALSNAWRLSFKWDALTYVSLTNGRNAANSWHSSYGSCICFKVLRRSPVAITMLDGFVRDGEYWKSPFSKNNTNSVFLTKIAFAHTRSNQSCTDSTTLALNSSDPALYNVGIVGNSGTNTSRLFNWRYLLNNSNSFRGCLVSGVLQCGVTAPWISATNYGTVQFREALGIQGKPIDILDHIDSLSAEEQVVAKARIEAVEAKAMAEMVPQPGLAPLFQYLAQQDIKKTICTRNLIKPVNHLLSQHLRDVRLDDPIITRAFLPPKPAPEPLLHIIQSWGLQPHEVVMVGDSIDDMLSGLRAGCAVVLIRHANNGHVIDRLPQIDHVIDRLDELVALLEAGLVVKDRSTFDPHQGMF